jgi:hypothetical protein
MSTDENDLIRTLSTLDLANDVPGRRVLLNRRCQQKPNPYRTLRRQPFEPLGVGNGQRRRRNPRRVVLVIEGPGMGQTMATRPFSTLSQPNAVPCQKWPSQGSQLLALMLAQGRRADVQSSR